MLYSFVGSFLNIYSFNVKVNGIFYFHFCGTHFYIDLVSNALNKFTYYIS